MDRQTGKITVHNYWIAVDPDIVLQPNHVRDQLESAIVFGLSAVLLEELLFKDGAPQASNFNDSGMADIRQIHATIVASDSRRPASARWVSQPSPRRLPVRWLSLPANGCGICRW